MLNAAAKKQGESTLKAQYEKLGERIKTDVAQIEKLIDQTSVPMFSNVPDGGRMDNLLAETEDCAFWQNFKRAAPIMFCMAIEKDEKLKSERDFSFINELLKTKSLLKIMNEKIQSGATDVDIVEYSLAVKMLENKMQMLNGINKVKDGDNEDKVTLNIQGTSKAVEIDFVKLREAITVLDKQVVEKDDDTMVRKAETVPEIDLANITEEEFLQKAAEIIEPVKKTERKTLAKETFLKVFRYAGDFAKMKNRDHKKEAQEKRSEHFNRDHKKYIESLFEAVKGEEKIYEEASQLLFDKISIS